MSFYEAYKSYCENAGVAETRVLKELGISHSVVNNWRNGSPPSNRTMRQIADYFNVTVEELKNGYKKITPPERSDLENEAIMKFKTLSPELQAEVLEYAAFLKARQCNE